MTTDTTPAPLDASGRLLYEEVDALRGVGPAVQVTMPGGLTAWSVTRGEVAMRLLTHPDISRNPRTSWPHYASGGAIPAWLHPWVDVESMLTADGADHTRLRKLVGKAFTPRRVEALRPAVEAIVTDLIDRLAERMTSQSVDLRAAFSYQLPTRLIGDLFGVPDEQRPQMLAVIDAILDTAATPEKSERTRRDMVTTMQQLLATRREQPGEDMTSLLLASRDDDGDRLTEAELISTLVLMIGAGSETAVSLIDHAVVELATRPDLLARVTREDLWDDVIEETLRLHPPIMHMPIRFATADIDLGQGVTLRPGDPIFIAFGAHGRDSQVHDHPASFAIDRRDKQHLAFGHGVHYCLGAPLGRLEARIALPALFEAFPRLHLAQEPTHLAPQNSLIANDYKRLPVHLA